MNNRDQHWLTGSHSRWYLDVGVFLFYFILIYSFEACASSAQQPPVMLHLSAASPNRPMLDDITNPITLSHHWELQSTWVATKRRNL